MLTGGLLALVEQVAHHVAKLIQHLHLHAGIVGQVVGDRGSIENLVVVGGKQREGRRGRDGRGAHPVRDKRHQHQQGHHANAAGSQQQVGVRRAALGSLAVFGGGDRNALSPVHRGLGD